MSAASLAGWTIDALIASTLLMGAVLLARGPVRRAFGAQLAYALWVLPALRLLLPPLPSGWWRTEAVAPVTKVGETIAVYLAPVAHAAAPSSELSLGVVVAAAWVAGGAVFLGWHLVRHTLFCRAVLRTGETLEERDGVQVIASAAAPGPLAFGVWRRYVAFPRDFAERYDADERALALLHELGHHQRRDLLANWAALLFLALHWFNPLAWRAFRAFRADQELANDARVLACCDAAARHAYGRAIVKAAHGKAISAACHLHTIHDLKGRLRMLATSRRSRRRLAAGTAALLLLGAGGLGLTASSGAAEQIRESLDTPLPAIAVIAPPATEPEIAPGPALAMPVGPTGPGSGGRHVSTTRTDHQVRVVVTENGRTSRYEGSAAEAWLAANPTPAAPVPPAAPVAPREMPPIPEVSSANCSDRGPAVEHRQRGGREHIVVCTNRIERMAREGAELAANSAQIERDAIASARAGLERARATVAANRDMGEEGRRAALAGIDEALTELATEGGD